MSIIYLKKNMNIKKYSEKSFVIRGETKDNRDLLKSLNGRFNPHLKGGPGWIFSFKSLKLIIDKIGKKEKKYICDHCSKKHKNIKKLEECCTCKKCTAFVEECQCEQDSDIEDSSSGDDIIYYV